MARLVGPLRLSQRIGARIRELRQRQAMTQEQLALASNLSPGFVALLESGTRLPSLAALIAVSSALNREAFELLLCDPADPRRDLIAAVREKDWHAVDAALVRLGRVTPNEGSSLANPAAENDRASAAPDHECLERSGAPDGAASRNKRRRST